MDSSILIAQLLIPVGLLIWQGRVRATSQIGWGLKTVLVLGYVVAIALAGLWMVIPWWVPYLYLSIWLVLAIVTLRGAMQQPRFPKRKGWAWAKVGLWGIIAGLVWTIATYIWIGYQPPAVSPASLIFPLKHGTYYIANGGNNELLNAHLDIVRSKRFREMRGTSYAVDIVKLNALGLRAPGLLPSDPAQYAIFGDPLYAPCSGVVLQSVNTVPDMSPPTVDREHERGNFLILQCDQSQVIIFMAHLKQGSVKVSAGDHVSTGQGSVIN